MDCKNTRSKGLRSHRRAFTLVELLVVIAIVAVLAGISVVGISRGMHRARETQTIAQFRDIGIGIQTFIGDYSRPPLTAAARAEGRDEIFGLRSQGESNRLLIGALMPNDSHFEDIISDIREINPRLETYINPPMVNAKKAGLGSDGVLYDPWGKEIIIALNAPPYIDTTQEGNGGVKDELLHTGNAAVYTDYKPRDQEYVMWTYGKDEKKGTPASDPDQVVGLSGSDDVISFK
jgi:prepilin-type N-terminal cleavage/methylation domain-containing protein